MIVESDIRLNASRVLDGSLSFDDFEDWLVSTSWNMHKDSSERAQEMVASIELSIFEKDMDGVMDILRSIQDPKDTGSKLADGDSHECRCDLRTRLVGDGCSVCNPELWKWLLSDENSF